MPFDGCQHARAGARLDSSLMSSIRQVVHIPCDGVELEAAFESPANARGVVVFAHGSGSSRMSPRNRFVAAALQRAGFATLRCDLLGEKEDWDLQQRFDIALLTERLVAAVRWTRANPRAADLRIGLFSASTGAAALRVAARPAFSIAAVVSRGGRPDLAGTATLVRVAAPTLLVVGAEDIDTLRMNEAAFAHLRCEKSLQVVPNATHLFEEPGALETAAALARDWFAAHLGDARALPAARRSARPPERSPA